MSLAYCCGALCSRARHETGCRAAGLRTVSLSNGGPETAPLEALQKPEAVARASAAYVKMVLDAGSSVAQVVVRRDKHFVGVVYKAGKIKALKYTLCSVCFFACVSLRPLPRLIVASIVAVAPCILQAGSTCAGFLASSHPR